MKSYRVCICHHRADIVLPSHGVPDLIAQGVPDPAQGCLKSVTEAHHNVSGPGFRGIPLGHPEILGAPRTPLGCPRGQTGFFLS